MTVREHEILDGLLTSFAEFKTAILGNGTKGLAERVGDLEQKDAPPSQTEIMKRRALEVAIMGVVLSAVTLLFKVIGLI